MPLRMFTVDLSRNDTAQVSLTAADRDAAADEAARLHPGFSVDGMVELGDDGTEAAEHWPVGRCESCQRRIWNGESYACDEEGCYTCAECMPDEADSDDGRWAGDDMMGASG